MTTQPPITTSNDSISGHCLCALITVTIHDSDTALFGPSTRRGHLCHCRNCRRVAGGIFGTNLAIEASKVTITGEEYLVEYVDRDTSSGTPMGRWFCGGCGSPIRSTSPTMGDKIVVKLGVFEKVPRPEWEAFAVRRQEWEVPVEGCVQYKLVGGPGKETLDA